MTAVMPEIEVDSDLIALLDFEPDLPCDGYDECESSAVWKMVVSCCGYVWLLCDMHHQVVMHTIEKAHRFRCEKCKHISVPASSIILSNEKI